MSGTLVELARLFEGGEISAEEFKRAFATLNQQSPSVPRVDVSRQVHEEELSYTPSLLRNNLGSYLIGLLVVAAASYFLHFFFGAVIGGAMTFGYIIAKHSTRLSVLDGHVLLEEGLLNKDRKELAASSIRSIRVRQSILQRMFRVGDIEIITAGDVPEITFRGLEEPHAFREKMKRYKGSLRGRSSHALFAA